MTRTQCYSCKEYGHIASNCSKKFCNYCKQQGHVIKECPTLPQNRRVNAFQSGINYSTIDNSSSGQVLTPEMVQQMIVSCRPFPALELHINDVTSNFWTVDSEASDDDKASDDDEASDDYEASDDDEAEPSHARS
ncbi:hypothetical protein MTR67_046200 [Solanum verrucosum]|uniref:CCHC-type domain-containing protein n=1 Tax=Solanum verrucosum TaxID=315347 RepID=A0AAF0UVG5_SOLVR|nr:hypothetical protein MTR67_046200 [Solanum verrucosum]